MKFSSLSIIGCASDLKTFLTANIIFANVSLVTVDTPFYHVES